MGNVAVNMQPVVTPKEKQKQHKVKQKREQAYEKPYAMPKLKVEKSIFADAQYLLFLITAIIVAFLLCINYVQCNANVTSSINKIEQLENKLFELKEENFTEENYINSKVNLIEVKRRAEEDLGMVYPEKGQIYFYKADKQDYVAQYATVE